MSRVLGESFADWFDKLLPDCATGQPETLFTPAIVSGRSDGKIAHLDGLNLSRAWCWRGIAAARPEPHPVADLARRSAEEHFAAALPHVAGHYMGEHWLTTFAFPALSAGIAQRLQSIVVLRAQVCDGSRECRKGIGRVTWNPRVRACHCCASSR